MVTYASGNILVALVVLFAIIVIILFGRQVIIKYTTERKSKGIRKHQIITPQGIYTILKGRLLNDDEARIWVRGKSNEGEILRINKNDIIIKNWFWALLGFRPIIFEVKKHGIGTEKITGRLNEIPEQEEYRSKWKLEQKEQTQKFWEFVNALRDLKRAERTTPKSGEDTTF